MAVDEDEVAGDPIEASGAPTGPRRSTFTPAEPDAYKRIFGADADSGSQPVPINAPPPSPATAVTPPPGSQLPRPPQRRSLADAELLSELDMDVPRHGGALDAIEKLQEQLAIREQEAREFRNWERSMAAIGTAEALEAVEETRLTFTEAIQIIPPFTALQPQQPAQPVLVTVDETTTPEESDAVFDLVEPEEPPHIPAGSELPPFALDLEAEGDTDAAEDDLEAVAVEPVPSPRTGPGEVVIVADAEIARQKVFSPEPSGVEPTMLEHRTGRSFRLFWLWFAANSSVLSVIFGVLLLSLGMSLRQAIVAALAGVALSFLPLGIGTLASKWNGQPTMVVSRASFGLVGNALPALLSLVTRLLWGAALLWFLASSTAGILFGAGLGGSSTELQLTIISAGACFLVALVVAFFGYALLARVQLALSVLSGALIAILVVVSWPLVDIEAALTVGDGPWVLVLAGAILVFSFVGLIWSTSSGDLARYQRPSTSGAAAMLLAPLGTALPSFALIVFGSLLAASDRQLAFGFVANPIQALTMMVPSWFIVPLICAVGIGLLSAVILSVYSGGFALQAIASPLRREVAVLITGIALGAIAIAMTLLSVDLTLIFRDLATTVAVPTAAWVGIFAAEVMIRNRRFDARSLVQPGGVYPTVRWLNLSMLIIASAIGFGLTTASAWWLSWQGYLLGIVGIPVGSELARADVGVVVALLVALATPIVAGIPAIRRQEEPRDLPDEQVMAPR